MAELRQASGTTYAKFYVGTERESECEAFSLNEYKNVIYSVTQFEEILTKMQEHLL